MHPEPTIAKPIDPPMRYVAGGRPGGNVRPLAKAEAGELVRFQPEQLRASPS